MSVMRRQPHGSAHPNRRISPSALWTGSLGRDVVSGAAIQKSAYLSLAANATGLAYSVSSTSALDRVVLNSANADKPGAGDFTALIRFHLRSIAGYAVLGRWYSGGALSTSDWYIGAEGQFGTSTADFVVSVGSTKYVATATAGWSVGHEYTLVGRRSGTTIYVDRYNHTLGLEHSGSLTNAGITTINSTAARKLKIGELDLGSTYNSGLDASVIALFPRCISNAELNALYGNVWSTFSAPRRVWWQLAAANDAGGSVSGTLSGTDGADVADFTGTHTITVTGTLAATDGADLAAFAGGESFSGTLSATDGADSATFSGIHSFGVDGTFSVVDGADSATFSGTHTVTVTGTFAITDGADSATLSGLVASAVSGTLTATDGADSVSFSGVVTGVSIWSPVGRSTTTWNAQSGSTTTWTTQ